MLVLNARRSHSSGEMVGMRRHFNLTPLTFGTFVICTWKFMFGKTSSRW
jgi:hypothetical protein